MDWIKENVDHKKSFVFSFEVKYVPERQTFVSYHAKIVSHAIKFQQLVLRNYEQLGSLSCCDCWDSDNTITAFTNQWLKQCWNISDNLNHLRVKRATAVPIMCSVKKVFFKTLHRYFPVNFVKFPRTLFLQNTSGWLLLEIGSCKSRSCKALNRELLRSV